ncbi:hypothetical protein GYMLUDRAFT_246509 [Collybiopsis luxurians FD-317 M1]|uniref:Uncharacterized protein n=1 Tax=Collybiopsis luxurians FD-317 M1 TaxID=944289 RepID=A0A0D0CQT1_9AGAR|nr:hypothetical protein GYMLUDRAFT_246509 [Collybiopsis luxurians FD-317 M1]
MKVTANMDAESGTRVQVGKIRFVPRNTVWRLGEEAFSNVHVFYLATEVWSVVRTYELKPSSPLDSTIILIAPVSWSSCFVTDVIILVATQHSSQPHPSVPRRQLFPLPSLQAYSTPNRHTAYNVRHNMKPTFSSFVTASWGKEFTFEEQWSQLVFD